MDIYPIPALRDNYIWALEQEDSLLIFDPGEASPVLKVCEEKNLKLTHILITHHHYDHTDGISELLQNFPKAKVYAKKHIKGYTYSIDGLNGIGIDIFNLSFSIENIPGHTLDHVMFFNSDIVFPGDTLFSAGCGRVFEGTMEQMFESLTKIKNLNDNISIYCAHEYTANNLKFAKAVEPLNTEIDNHIQTVANLSTKQPTLPTTLALEKQINPFLRTDIDKVIDSAENYAGKKLNTEIEVFQTLREWKDNFS